MQKLGIGLSMKIMDAGFFSEDNIRAMFRGKMVYWFLKGKGIGNAKEIAGKMEPVFSKYSKWRNNIRQDRDIRIEFNRILNGNSRDPEIVGKNAETVKEIMELLRGAIK